MTGCSRTVFNIDLRPGGPGFFDCVFEFWRTGTGGRSCPATELWILLFVPSFVLRFLDLLPARMLRHHCVACTLIYKSWTRPGGLERFKVTCSPPGALSELFLPRPNQLFLGFSSACRAALTRLEQGTATSHSCKD